MNHARKEKENHPRENTFGLRCDAHVSARLHNLLSLSPSSMSTKHLCASFFPTPWYMERKKVTEQPWKEKIKKADVAFGNVVSGSEQLLGCCACCKVRAGSRCTLNNHVVNAWKCT